VRKAPDDQIVRANPIQYAADHGRDEAQVIDLFHGETTVAVAQVGGNKSTGVIICAVCASSCDHHVRIAVIVHIGNGQSSWFGVGPTAPGFSEAAKAIAEEDHNIAILGIGEPEFRRRDIEIAIVIEITGREPIVVLGHIQFNGGRAKPAIPVAEID